MQSSKNKNIQRGAGRKESERGAAMMISVIFFILISLVIVIGLAGPSAREHRVASSTVVSKQSYLLAESGIEDAFYRLKNSMQIDSTETITLGGASATTSVTTLSGNQKQIDSTGNASNLQRTASLTLLTGAGVAFNYGLQAGYGGVTIDGGSSINGNVYSNGNVLASGGAAITGSAVAADGPALAPDQSNGTGTPATNVTFGNNNATQDIAQSFQFSTTAALNKARFYIRKTGSPANATVRIVADASGSPSNTTLASGTLSASSVGTSYGWVDASFSTNPSLPEGTLYWLVIDASTSSSNYYVIGASSGGYASGQAKIGRLSSTWNNTSPAGLDLYFSVYLGGNTSRIGGASYVGGVAIGQGGVGDAWATNVQGTSVAGTIYCQSGTYNNKSCNTSRSAPPALDLPFSEGNIQDWKDSAALGGTISGNYAVGWAGATLGPKKIEGNLTVSGGGTLTMTGTLWVTGTVTVTGGGKIILPANYGQFSETIVSDSIVTINGGGSTGSGSSGSYLFIVSTSRCPNDAGCSGASAITITGGAGSIAVDAQYGTVALSGGASIKAVAANAITATGGTAVTYDSGLASPSFSSGPSGSYTVGSWRETN